MTIANFRWRGWLLGVGLILAMTAAPAQAALVTLAWDASPDTSVTGYRLLYGTVPGVYSNSVDVGSATQYAVPGLGAETTYYFVVQAYGALGQVSGPSNEVAFTVPLVRRTGRLMYDPVAGTWSQPLLDETGTARANSPGWTVKKGDFNGDGWQDMLLYNQSTGDWYRVTDNREGTYHFFGYKWAPGWVPYVVDLNGDGLSDLFLYNPATGQYFRCLSYVGGQDFSYSAVGLWGKGWDIYPADFDGDGRDDLFLYASQNPNLPPGNRGLTFRVLSQPDGSFAYIQGDLRWAPDWQITPADFNGDGRSDLFLYRSTGQWFRVTFYGAASSYAGGVWAKDWNITPGDFNGDGRSDLFIYNRTNGMWFTVTTNAGIEFDYKQGLWAPNWQIAPASFNNDAMTDLTLYNSTNGQWFEATTYAPGVFGFTTGTTVTGSTKSLIR